MVTNMISFLRFRQVIIYTTRQLRGNPVSAIEQVHGRKIGRDAVLNTAVLWNLLRNIKHTGFLASSGAEIQTKNHIKSKQFSSQSRNSLRFMELKVHYHIHFPESDTSSNPVHTSHDVLFMVHTMPSRFPHQNHARMLLSSFVPHARPI